MCICYYLTQLGFYFINCALNNNNHPRTHVGAKLSFCTISQHLRGGRRWSPHRHRSPACQCRWSHTRGDGSYTGVSRWQTPCTSRARNGLTSGTDSDGIKTGASWRRRDSRESAATHVKVLALPEGVELDLPLLTAPASSQPAVPHNDLLLHPGVQVEGDVLGAAPHKVKMDSAATTRKSGSTSRN